MIRVEGVRLLLADIRDLPPTSTLEAAADPSRRAQSGRMRGDARLRSLAAGWLLFQAFGARSYRRNLWGRPELVGGGPHFSLSHSGRWVLLAVSDAPCGCDIEERRENRPFDAIAKRHFHPDEYADFLRLGAAPALFYRLWTLSEAYMKGVGKGFALPPRLFRHAPDPPHRLLTSTEPGFGDWHFHVGEDIPGATYAIAVRDGGVA